MSPKTIAKISLPLLLFIGLLIIYIHNLSRSVYGGDVGDLVTAAAVLGIPHPPGYPLFTLLGYFFIQLVPFSTPAFAVGLISAISAAGCVTVFYLFLTRVTKNFLVSLVASLTLAFFYLFWLYAEVAEVFALNTFFAVLLLYVSILFKDTGAKKYLYLLAFLCGVAFTHHQTIILIFPAVLILIGKQLWSLRTDIRVAIRLIAVCLVLFFAPFLVYLYAPLASSRHPVVDWAHITDIQSVFDLILRKRYGTFSAGAFPETTPLEKMVILKTYAFSMLSQLTIPVTLFSLVGAISLFKKDKALSFAGVVGFLISGPLFILYAGFPLYNTFYYSVAERFTILSTLFILFFFPFGLQAFSGFLMRFFTKKYYIYLFEGIFLLIPFMLFFYNYPKTNLATTNIGDELGENFIAPSPLNSILFLSGDTTLFNPWYVRYARGFREDVDVFNLNDISNNYFLKNFSRTTFGKDADIKDKKVFETLDKTRPLFSTQPFQIDKNDLITWVPYGLVYEYRNKSETEMTKEAYQARVDSINRSMLLPNFTEIRHVSLGNATLSDMPGYYLHGFTIQAAYFLSEYKDADLALVYYQKILERDPLYAQGYAAIGSVYLTEKKDCKNAANYFKSAIALEETQRSYYLLLYLSYKTCNEPEKLLIEERKRYAQKFTSSIIYDLQEELGNKSGDSK